MGDKVIVLGDGQGDAGDVGFLEGVGADELAADLSGDANDRRGIEHGGGDAGDHVGRAGAGGGDGDANFAAGARVAISHVGGALLVAHQDVMDIAVLQGVIRRKDCASGIAEDVLYAFALQAFPQNLCTGFSHGPFSSSLVEKTTAELCPAEGGCPHANRHTDQSVGSR